MKLTDTLRDVLVGLWLVLVAVTFWGPYLAVVVPVNAGHAWYAGFLVVSIVTVVFHFLRRNTTP